MKIRHLELRAYGPFSGQSITFGNRPFHVIFGPNEAGKSSTLAAVTDALFGIPARTFANFQIPYPQLRIGMQLEHSQGESLVFVRRKANSQTLRAADDSTPLEESRLKHFVGDVDRESFQMMFGIDHTRLRQGGAEIAAGGGQVGEMLFMAGTGVAHLRKLSQRLTAAADQLFKARGTSSEIRQKVDQFLKLRQSMKESQVSVDHWKQLQKQVDDLQGRKTRIDAELRDLRLQRARWERLAGSVLEVIHWSREQQELAAIPDTPELVAEFRDRLDRVLQQRTHWQSELNDAREGLEKVQHDSRGLNVDTQLLGEESALIALRDQVGAYLEARQDRPGLVADCENAQAQAREILRRLGRDGDIEQAESLRLPVDRIVRIQNLGNGLQGLVERRDAAAAEQKRKQRTIKQLESELATAAPTMQLGSLKETVRSVQQLGDLEKHLADARATSTKTEKKIRLLLQQLPLWDETLETLLPLAVPLSPTVKRFEKTQRTLTSEQSKVDQQREDLEGEISQAEQSLAAFEQAGTIPTEEELQQARLRRSEGWSLVREEWLGGGAAREAVAAYCRDQGDSELAQAYEQSVSAADSVVDLLRGDADRAAQKLQFQHKLRQLESRREKLLSLQAELTERQVNWQQEWTELWKPIGIAPLPPEDMLEWLGSRQKILDLADQLREQQSQVDEFHGQRQRSLELLNSELTALTPPPAGADSLNRQLQRAEDLLEEMLAGQTRQQEKHNRLAVEREALIDLSAQLETREQELSAWEQDWASEMQQLGLEPNASTAEANAVLSELQLLFVTLREASDKQTRISGIDGRAARFRQTVRDLLCRLEWDIDEVILERSPEQYVNQFNQQLQLTRDNQTRNQTLTERAAEWNTQQQRAEQELERLDLEFAELSRQAGTADPDLMRERAVCAARQRELTTSLRNREANLLAQAAGQELQDFIAEVQQSVPQRDEFPALMEDLAQQIGQAEQERDQLIEQITAVRVTLSQLNGGDAAAEQALACESLAAGIEQDLQRLVSLRIASTWLQQAIERYREKNQGPVLSKANTYFSRMTCGAFSGLQAEFDESLKPVLKGVRAAGGPLVGVEGMSDGTCDQLYLALRLASIETWYENHESLPLVVDDILLNFDDARAAATLVELSSFARHSQVLFFTHHQHLLTLLKQHVPDDLVQYHTLETRT